MPNFISEDQIEKALLQKLRKQFDYELLNCYTSNPENLNDRSKRTDKRDVILCIVAPKQLCQHQVGGAG